jgi:predicted phage gp36 major capsid-like protein
MAPKAAIPPRFLINSTFIANPGIWDTTYRFTGGSTAEPPQMPTREGNFMGRPKVEATAFVTTTSTGSKIMAVGDFWNFLICDRIGTDIELIPHLGGANRLPTGQRESSHSGGLVHRYSRRTAFRYLEVK